MAARKPASKPKAKARTSAKIAPPSKGRTAAKASPGSRPSASPKAPSARVQAAAPKARIFPFLWYARDAEKAAKFYASIFPNSRVDSVTAMQSESPSGPPGSVRVVDFTLFGQRFQAMTAGPHQDFNDAISITVLCEDQAELDRYWNALLEGGGQPYACGWLSDRWGVRWQIVPMVFEKLMADPDKARSKRVTDAMLQMIKFDIAALEKAARG